MTTNYFHLWLLIPFTIFAGLSMYAGETKKARMHFIMKPIPMFVNIVIAIVALSRPELSTVYARLVLVGLILSVIGDMCLAANKNSFFVAGVFSFLLAHVAYSIAFTMQMPFAVAQLPILALLAIPAIGVFVYLLPNLKTMAAPIILYILVITFMLWRAISWGVFGDMSALRSALIIIGASAFYVSDFFVAQGQFKTPWKFSVVYCLVLYYGAQYLFAISALAW